MSWGQKVTQLMKVVISSQTVSLRSLFLTFNCLSCLLVLMFPTETCKSTQCKRSLWCHAKWREIHGGGSRRLTPSRYTLRSCPSGGVLANKTLRVKGMQDMPGCSHPPASVPLYLSVIQCVSEDSGDSHLCSYKSVRDHHNEKTIGKLHKCH